MGIENDDTDDISADIRKAMGEEKPVADYTDAGEVVTIAAPAETPPADDVGQSDGAARGPDGKFIAKAGEAAQQSTPDQPLAAPAEAPEPIRPPASWSAAAKSAFTTLPPLLQQEVMKRERDMDQGLQERANRLKSYEPIDQVLAPYRDKFTMAGVEPHQAVQRLLAAQDILDRDFVGGVRQLAQTYGVHPHQLAQALAQGQSAPQQQALPPELQQAMQKISTLEQNLNQRTQAEENAKRQAIADQISAFQADPANLYFENVQDDMVALISAGRAKDLADAYTKACRANDEVWPLILADQKKADAAEAAKRAQVARQASGSVTGSPGQGVANGQRNPNATLEDDIRASMAEVSGRA